MQVLLTYFKMNGKFYSNAAYTSNERELEEIRKEVRRMSKDRLLPGLRKNHDEYIISIDVPNHKNNHPHLIIM